MTINCSPNESARQAVDSALQFKNNFA